MEMISQLEAIEKKWAEVACNYYLKFDGDELEPLEQQVLANRRLTFPGIRSRELSEILDQKGLSISGELMDFYSWSNGLILPCFDTGVSLITPANQLGYLRDVLPEYFSDWSGLAELALPKAGDLGMGPIEVDIPAMSALNGLILLTPNRGGTILGAFQDERNGEWRYLRCACHIKNVYYPSFISMLSVESKKATEAMAEGLM